MGIQFYLFTAYIFILTSAISFFMIPLLIRLAKKFDIIDYPNHRKIHTTPTPLLGGIAIWGAFTIALATHVSLAAFLKDFITNGTLFSSRLQFYANNTTCITNQVFAVLGGGLIIAIVGNSR